MRRHRFSIVVAVLVMTAAGSLALGDQPTMQQHHMGTGPMPTQPGQDAFGAIQEIVRLLEAVPATDWSKVDLEALREHLIDMNEVTLHAAVVNRPVEGGVASGVTGGGRTPEAIRRMVTAQARQLAMMAGWRVLAEPLPEGMRLTVTTDRVAEIAHIRGLGFIGLLATGAHHQAHHLALARGEPMP